MTLSQVLLVLLRAETGISVSDLDGQLLCSLDDNLTLL